MTSFVSPLLDARLKRQIVRWLIYHKAPVNKDVLDLLAACLQDEDWEVRMSAMFAAGRLNAAQLAPKVDRVKIPSRSKDGFDSRDHHTLVAARQIIVAQLEGYFATEKFENTVAKMATIPASFIRTVLGMTQPDDPFNSDSLFIESLTVPADTDVHIPGNLPPGLERKGDSVFLGDTGIELVWIAPLTHWLGDATEYLPVENPIRQFTPDSGYFIAKRPLSALTVSSTIKNDQLSGRDIVHPLKEDYVLATFTAAERLCGSLSDITDAAVELPTADQWEMAARGPDGRRYPTGNGLERDMLLRGSPWGVFDAIGIVGQWCKDDSNDRVVVCGDARDPRCAARRLPSENESVAVRPVVNVAQETSIIAEAA